MRKLIVVASLVMVASMLLAACGPTATPATTVPPTQAGAPATEAPTAEPTAAPVSNPYIGSGKVDGNGVPPEFFNDPHVRKGFAYAFDWTTYITDVFAGEAIQPLELALPGMPGFDPAAPHYTYDLAKSAEEFKASTLTSADGKSLWDVGFRVQMLYNQGNTSRQIIAEVMASNLAKVNPLFQVEVLGLPWPAYLAAQRAGQIPIMTAGWLEDIHDPHNWYQPYTLGAYGGRSNLPADLKAQFKVILDKGVALTDPAARTEVYKGFNQLYYDQAVGVPLVLATSHGFENTWVQGRILNPIYPGLYFYPMSKAAGAKNPTTFTYATIGDMDTLDPALAYDTASGETIQNIYQTLVFYDGEATDKFVPMLADAMPTISADGLTYTFHIRANVKFHNGDVMTPSDVAYSFQRGLLQGGGVSPQWLLSEPFFGVGNQDVTALIDPALADDQANLAKVDPAKLVEVCQKVKGMIAADDAAGTVTMTLAQPWGPFLATIAQTWGSVLDQKWVAANKGWDGTCETWQNFYGMQSADDPISGITNGTGAYMLDHWTKGTEIVMTKNPSYWGTAPALDRAVIQIIPEWGTRFAELQAGDADIVDVPVENRSQVDAMVKEFQVYDASTNTYGPLQQLCSIDSTQTGPAKYIACKPGETAPTGKTMRLRIGRPGITMDVMLFNWAIH